VKVTSQRVELDHVSLKVVGCRSCLLPQGHSVSNSRLACFEHTGAHRIELFEIVAREVVAVAARRAGDLELEPKSKEAQ
jgi:hypothetical protein